MSTKTALLGTLALAAAGLTLLIAGPRPPLHAQARQTAPAPGPAPAPAPAQVQAQAAAAAPGQAQAAPAPAPAFTPEQKAVVDAVAAFTKAYNSADVKAVTAVFTDDVVLTDPEGAETRGKAAVAEMYAASFQDSQGLKLEAQVAEVRFITPDVARVEGQSRLSAATGDASEFNRFSALLVRRAGKWQAAEIRESTAPAEDVSPYERLQELEWMVGHWVNEVGNTKVEADVRWAENNSFLVRTYTSLVQGEKPSSGTQFIGWDPQTGQIKSWSFNSEGGHGEALWTRTSEEEWVVKAQGVMHDGRPTSATQIHTILNKDSIKTNSIDRIIGGQFAPDVLDVVMVRKPPQPTATPAPAPAAAGTSR